MKSVASLLAFIGVGFLTGLGLWGLDRWDRTPFAAWVVAAAVGSVALWMYQVYLRRQHRVPAPVEDQTLVTINDDQRQFIKDVYGETGQQLRNNNLVRGTVLTFYLVMVGGFVGVIARADDSLSRMVWLFPLLLSAWALVFNISIAFYQRQAVLRQRAIAFAFVSDRNVQVQLEMERAVPFTGLALFVATYRQELLFGSVFLPAVIVGCWWMIWGDWFGIAVGPLF